MKPTKPETLGMGIQKLEAAALDHGVVRLNVSTVPSRMLGMVATLYLVDDILIDTGFSRAGDVVRKFFADRAGGRSVRAIACTHSHEDHTGNCAALQEQLGCPVYLKNSDWMWEEGVGSLKPYRSFFWGWPGPYRPEEMPSEIRGARRVLQAIGTPGHSRTHAVFFEEATGLLFAGDLFVSGGVTAVMVHEDPFALARSLRVVAALPARVLLNGHGLVLEAPGPRLLEKADRIERAADRVVRLHEEGVSEREIVTAVFGPTRPKDFLHEHMTGGDFSRVNFVRACVLHSHGLAGDYGWDAV